MAIPLGIRSQKAHDKTRIDKGLSKPSFKKLKFLLIYQGDVLELIFTKYVRFACVIFLYSMNSLGGGSHSSLAENLRT